jgi:HD-GYP domain-containing protein (c-di-GMP phosphodiesterase class II)
VLARSVLNPSRPDTPLLKRGVRLNPRILSGLRRFGVRSLWLEGDGMGYLESFVREERFEAGRHTLGQLRDTFSQLSGDVAYEGNFNSYRKRVVEIFRSIQSNTPVYCLLDDIYGREGDILFHGGNVCYLSMLMGLELEAYIFDERRPSAGKELAGQLAPLGLGALLHDVGKLELPETVRTRPPWELSDEERELLRSHTLKGYAALKDQVGVVAANPALCHHRNLDGSGYPQPDDAPGHAVPEGGKLHIFTRIVAAANAYEELVGYRDYLPIEALEELNCARGHHLDPKALSALNRIVPPFGLGERVRLSSGHQGMVVDFDPDRPFRPTVALLADPNGQPLPEKKRLELPLADYPQFHVVVLRERSVEHLLPDDPDARWEDLS